jgi:hypothetical protein
LETKELSKWQKRSNQIHLSLSSIYGVTTCLLHPFLLNTTDNSIGAEGAVQLSEALKSNSTLTAFGLECNKLLCFIISFSLNTVNNIDAQLKRQVVQHCEQNLSVWTQIHDLIKKSDLEQLMTLLSKHTINLNSFNLSVEYDTILHSAAMSNSVKMMEFILQRISPQTKQRMLKMKNYLGKLPSDLVTRWAPSTHSLFPLQFRQVVKAVLMLGAKRQDGTPFYPQTQFYKLPKDVVFLILHYAVPDN